MGIVLAVARPAKRYYVLSVLSPALRTNSYLAVVN